MDKIENFPEKLHLLFGKLVATKVSQHAENTGMLVDDYIHSLSRGEDDPPFFSNNESLEKVYEQYSELIEASVEKVNLAPVMSTTNKTYLCYRLYLHSMSIEFHGLDASVARLDLLKALRDYYRSRGSRFPLSHEMALMDLINSLSDESASKSEPP